MSDDSQQPIIIKRVKKVAGGGHGGAWKIAYADFVTAMMAFFLVMWLLASSSDTDLAGLAENFENPARLALTGGSSVGESSSIIPGGGEDLTRSVGQVKRGTTPGSRTPKTEEDGMQADGSPIAAEGGVRATEGASDAAAQLQAEMRERGQLMDLKGRIEAIIEANPDLRAFKDQILMDITTEGLRIQIVDEKNRPMFNSGSDRLLPYTRKLMRIIGQALNGVPNYIGLSGHTDASAFAGGQRGFSNWELSSNRANASRREMVAGGLEPEKLLRVVGLADTAPFDNKDAFAPANRRISILVLNKKAADAIRTKNREQSGLTLQHDARERISAIERRARGQ